MHACPAGTAVNMLSNLFGLGSKTLGPSAGSVSIAGNDRRSSTGDRAPSIASVPSVASVERLGAAGDRASDRV